MTQFGIDRLLGDEQLLQALRGHRVALLAHPASVTRDLTTSVVRTSFGLPDRLAGSPRSGDLVQDPGGSATYGRGLARFVVLPLPHGCGSSAFDAARAGGSELDVGRSGDAALITTLLLNVVAVRGDPAAVRVLTPEGRSYLLTRTARWYLIAGTVQPPILEAAASDLVRPPTGMR